MMAGWAAADGWILLFGVVLRVHLRFSGGVAGPMVRLGGLVLLLALGGCSGPVEAWRSMTGVNKNDPDPEPPRTAPPPPSLVAAPTTAAIAPIQPPAAVVAAGTPQPAPPPAPVAMTPPPPPPPTPGKAPQRRPPPGATLATLDVAGEPD